MSDRKPDASESIKLTIREAGLRATPARIATLKLLHGATSPLTHAEVAEELHDLGVDKATVFRNLNDMATAGLLRRTELGDRVWRFELIGENEGPGSAHPHFVCNFLLESFVPRLSTTPNHQQPLKSHKNISNSVSL